LKEKELFIHQTPILVSFGNIDSLSENVISKREQLFSWFCFSLNQCIKMKKTVVFLSCLSAFDIKCH